MIHWLNLEFWGPVWPNLAASALTFTVGGLWAHRKLVAKWEEQEKARLRRHNELKDMLSQQAVSGDAGDTSTSGGD